MSSAAYYAYVGEALRRYDCSEDVNEAFSLVNLHFILPSISASNTVLFTTPAMQSDLEHHDRPLNTCLFSPIFLLP